MARKLLSRTLTAMICVFALGACGSVPRAAPGYSVHDFGPLGTAPARPPALPIRNTEVVSAPWLASTSMHYRLMYAQPTRRQVFVESRWAAQPGQLFELAVKRTLKANDSTPTASGCRLRVELDEFAQVFASERESSGILEARVFLLAPRSDQLVASRSFSIARPAPSANAAGGVAALREGVEQFNRELLGWLDTLAAEGAGPRGRCGT